MKLRLYQHRLAAIRLRTAQAAARHWDQLERWDAEDAEPFARSVSPLIAAGQLLAAGVVNAYVARTVDQPVVRLAADQVVGSVVRNGTPLDEIYQRPFAHVWSQLANGATHTEAVTSGRNLLLTLANTDVWLATRATTAVIDRASPVITSWVRAADADACDDCANADGMPMGQAADLAGHPNCGCTSIPITGDNDSQAADAEAVEIEHDDELGPMLRPAN